jgi:serine/threonine-protein kinase RsbW
LFAVELLAREALNNAVLHGCDGDPDQLVDFEIQFSGKTLCLIIQDAGPGFDWRAIMREDLVDEEKVNGRGLRIYSRYADRVVFNEPGNCVKLYRYLPGNEDGEQPRAGNSEPERNGK